ncbi:tetratricopeptide repeat protein [Bacillus infantis]|jgi:tetratricopeptide (TPR) repeat protein|uniref:tetratricopeptide repeat protein n=1 Tax=Bacillus infantis TaxID=324767 RepID=UPI0021550736|nr:tetratricopeptide repeat protein [Bacillus infantis]MCR6612202.1 tetratricopeptide repeat protein [Bacillus infantis]
MTKRNQNDSSNIIPFPGLEKRLLEKGLESLQGKKFSDAIKLFEDAKELDPESSDIHIGLVLAYFEAGALKKAKNLAKSMLQEGIGDYFEIVDLYLMIMVQLHEYGEIAATIEALLQEREIPKDKLEHFAKMLHFSRRMAEGIPDPDAEEKLHGEYKDKELNLLSYQDPKEQVLLLAKLANINVRPYLDELKSYLISEEGHPFLKTMIINILKEQEYDKPVTVQKLGMKEEFIPSALHDVHDHKQLRAIEAAVKDKLEHEDPVLLENIIALLERQFFLLYPFKLQPDEPDLWAAAYHLVGCSFYGMDGDPGELAGQYGVEADNLETSRIFIGKIEEISYPNI